MLGRIRDGVLPVTADLVSLVLRALDRVKAIVAGLGATGAEPAGDDAALLTALDEAAEGSGAKPKAVAATGAIVLGAAVPRAPEVDPSPPNPDAMAAQTIRVTVDVLEDLMTLVSELVLTRNQLLQLARGQESAFTVPLQRLSQITSDLQDGVMKTRMQPIGNAWNKLPRLIRDLARDLGKQIELTMRGQD